MASKNRNMHFKNLDLLKAYRDMLLIRRFEEKAGQLYGMGLIAGFCHLYIGQEAVVVALQALSKPEDSIITAYRDHGHMLACGMDPRGVMAELTGRSGGLSKGKGGSMHMFSREKNFYGGHGIVGAQVPLGTGLALAHKYNNEEAICFAYMGDGAANQGQVYESYNMASLWNLPILYIIENNKYSMGTAENRHSSSDFLFKRGSAWNIPGKAVDGMNLLDTYAGAQEAIEYVRSGKGPYILEVDTYRYRGHSMSDPGTYREKDEVQKIKEHRDPLLTVKNILIKEHGIDEKSLKTIDKEVKDIVNDSAKFSQESPEPDAKELYTDIYKRDRTF